MSDTAQPRVWTMRIAFATLVVVILFWHLLPLQTAAGGLIWPDLILTFALAWSVRRPDYLPGVLLALAFLLSDLLLQRPPGLWALLALLACERMKTQSTSLRDASIMTEMVQAAASIAFVFIGYRVVLWVLLVDAPQLVPTLIQMIITILAYPLVVGITHGLMGVRKTAPSDFTTSRVRP